MLETVEKPWVAFKVMAAGAIHPRVGFHYAFRGGADFVIAGNAGAYNPIWVVTTPG